VEVQVLQVIQLQGKLLESAFVGLLAYLGDIQAWILTDLLRGVPSFIHQLVVLLEGAV
jgi:hypothetical protein